MLGLFTSLMDVSYLVSDWQRAKKFYGETLGLPVAAFMGDEVGWMEFGDKENTHLAIAQWRGPGPVPTGNGNGTAVFGSNDVQATLSELRKRRVRCEEIVVVPQMVAYFNFYDPDGNRLQVAGMPPQS